MENMISGEILIVEDDKDINELLATAVKRAGYDIVQAWSGTEAAMLFSMKDKEISLVLLDLMLPGMPGEELLTLIRKKCDIPVIVITAKDELDDKIDIFAKGADDYITKPFSLNLVKMHIEAVLKRAGKMRDVLEYRELRLDKSRQTLYRNEEPIETTRKEYELLLYFMEHEGMILQRNTILDAVWEYDYEGDIRTIDTLVKQLRRKLGEECNYIRTVYGVGYVFGEDNSEK